MKDERLTDKQLADVLGLDSVGELIEIAKVADGQRHSDSPNDTLYIQTCDGAWVALNSPSSRWEFHKDEQWE